MDCRSSFRWPIITVGISTIPRKSARFIAFLLQLRSLSLPNSILPGRSQVRPAIPLVTCLIRFRADGTIFPIADARNPVRRHAELHQKLLGGGGAPVPETQVVLGRT